MAEEKQGNGMDLVQRLRTMEEHMAEMQKELQVLREQNRPVRQFDFPFRMSFRWEAQAWVELPEQLGAERRVFLVNGEKTIELNSTRYPWLASLQIVEERIALSPTSVVLQRRPRNLAVSLPIPELTIGMDAIDQSSSEGYVDLQTGQFSFQFAINLTQKTTPVLEMFGADEVPIIVQEAGHLDFDEPANSRSTVRFFIAPDYEGEFHFASSASKNCRTAVSLCATVDGSQCSESATVYVCAGKEIHLWWESSEDVTEARIDPYVGPVQPTGHTTVRVEQTTTFTVTAKGQCQVTESVRIVVVRPGDTAELSAPWIRLAESFYLEIPEQFCDPDVRVTYIEPICAPGCFVHKPPILHPYPYLPCGNGTYRCNGEWSGQKLDPGSSAPRYFTVPMARVPLNFYPLAGVWRFLPLIIQGEPFGTANFKVTLECRR